MIPLISLELENFQAIELRTRIEFRPITMLFGPNSAGKSTIFDALELLRVLLDPIAFDQALAEDMVLRWARKKGDTPAREMFLAIEFPFKLSDIWSGESNWKCSLDRTEAPIFYIDKDDHVDAFKLEGSTVRLEVVIKVIEGKRQHTCGISAFRCLLKHEPIVSVTQPIAAFDISDQMESRVDDSEWPRSLLIHNNRFDILEHYIFQAAKNLSAESRFTTRVIRHGGYDCLHTLVNSSSLCLFKFVPFRPFGFDHDPHGVSVRILRLAFDFVFYFGTMGFMDQRDDPALVRADRVAPKPDDALFVVDLGFDGWWSKAPFSASSAASLLLSTIKNGDEHFYGLAKVAFADLLIKTSRTDFWGSSHAATYIDSVRELANNLDRVNHHLERNIFTEKLYKLSCAATLMVPIDLSEDDPWSYYALAQPAVVRLFLQDGEGSKVEFQDVGSGIPFVLPVLFVAVLKGIAKVQQPELHLHPALQSSVADVVIEEFNRAPSRLFIIETHSEHMLLRFLRRVRDFEKGKCLSDELRLTNNDLAIYYFDPQVSGGTVVSRQLVTPLGDFYTDWPRGFFAERNQDLFND